MEARVIKVGTRQSQLALTQTGQVIKQLEELCQKHDLPYSFEIHKIVTKGDKILDVTLSKVGGKGLFVKEIEQALLNSDIDLAIHSMKDMPYELPEGLMIGAVPKRLTPQDCLVLKQGYSFEDLPQGAKVGTSSLRRSSQLKYARPDLDIQWIRGNIDSRIRKLETEGFDAIVLATAGLMRMGWEHKISTLLPADVCVPAVGQGALGVQCRTADESVKELLALLNDHDSEITVAAERSFLGTLQGGCQVPIGAHATIVERNGDEEVLELTGIVGSPDGVTLLKSVQRGADAVQLGEQVARQLLDDGARDILAKIEG
ncbi:MULTISPECIES: hydroxymethylbilane synthase [Paenibacillus]|uniref:hydroxymethylbilane synthase n=1 Tax=Paenibacillus TaxID=44249 RepID=UPI0020403655|nr:hydroxymethylbilane synthase [Paenibacillus camelliae]MCM3632460.1 hydroxymethylbilane synthase [Paenibacillus camelliae]